MQKQKWQHPFFLGLCILFISFFFTALKIKTSNLLPGYDSPEVSVSGSLWNMAMGSNLDLNISIPVELKRYELREIERVERFLVTPRFAGVYFLVVLILLAWGFILFFVYKVLPQRKIKVLSVSIAAVFTLFVLMVVYEYIHYNNLIKKIEDSYRFSETTKIVPQLGMWIFIAGLITLFIGSFSDYRPKVHIARPAYQP